MVATRRSAAAEEQRREDAPPSKRRRAAPTPSPQQQQRQQQQVQQQQQQVQQQQQQVQQQQQQVQVQQQQQQGVHATAADYGASPPAAAAAGDAAPIAASPPPAAAANAAPGAAAHAAAAGCIQVRACMFHGNAIRLYIPAEANPWLADLVPGGVHPPAEGAEVEVQSVNMTYWRQRGGPVGQQAVTLRRNKHSATLHLDGCTDIVRALLTPLGQSRAISSAAAHGKTLYFSRQSDGLVLSREHPGGAEGPQQQQQGEGGSSSSQSPAAAAGSAPGSTVPAAGTRSCGLRWLVNKEVLAPTDTSVLPADMLELSRTHPGPQLVLEYSSQPGGPRKLFVHARLRTATVSGRPRTYLTGCGELLRDMLGLGPSNPISPGDVAELVVPGKGAAAAAAAGGGRRGGEWRVRPHVSPAVPFFQLSFQQSGSVFAVGIGAVDALFAEERDDLARLYAEAAAAPTSDPPQPESAIGAQAGAQSASTPGKKKRNPAVQVTMWYVPRGGTQLQSCTMPFRRGLRSGEATYRYMLGSTREVATAIFGPYGDDFKANVRLSRLSDGRRVLSMEALVAAAAAGSGPAPAAAATAAGAAGGCAEEAAVQPLEAGGDGAGGSSDGGAGPSGQGGARRARRRRAAARKSSQAEEATEGGDMAGGVEAVGPLAGARLDPPDDDYAPPPGTRRLYSGRRRSQRTGTIDNGAGARGSGAASAAAAAGGQDAAAASPADPRAMETGADGASGSGAAAALGPSTQPEGTAATVAADGTDGAPTAATGTPAPEGHLGPASAAASPGGSPGRQDDGVLRGDIFDSAPAEDATQWPEGEPQRSQPQAAQPDPPTDSTAPSDLHVTSATLADFMRHLGAQHWGLVDAASYGRNHCALSAVLSQVPGSVVPFWPQNPQHWLFIMGRIRAFLSDMVGVLLRSPSSEAVWEQLCGLYPDDVGPEELEEIHLEGLRGAAPLTLFDLRILQGTLLPYRVRLVLHVPGRPVQYLALPETFPPGTRDVHFAAVHDGWMQHWRAKGCAPEWAEGKQLPLNHYMALLPEREVAAAAADMPRRARLPPTSAKNSRGNDLYRALGFTAGDNGATPAAAAAPARGLAAAAPPASGPAASGGGRDVGGGQGGGVPEMEERAEGGETPPPVRPQAVDASPNPLQHLAEVAADAAADGALASGGGSKPPGRGLGGPAGLEAAAAQDMSRGWGGPAGMEVEVESLRLTNQSMRRQIDKLRQQNKLLRQLAA